MKQFLGETFALPISTGATEYGPNITYTGSSVRVVIDDCDKELEIIFNGTLALKFTPDISCNEFHIKAYSNVCEVLNSEWIKKLELEARDQSEKFPQDRSHFMIYFDHHGVLELIGIDYVVGS